MECRICGTVTAEQSDYYPDRTREIAQHCQYLIVGNILRIKLSRMVIRRRIRVTSHRLLIRRLLTVRLLLLLFLLILLLLLLFQPCAASCAKQRIVLHLCAAVRTCFHFIPTFRFLRCHKDAFFVCIVHDRPYITDTIIISRIRMSVNTYLPKNHVF